MSSFGPKPPESSTGYDDSRPFFQKVFPAPGKGDAPPKKPFGSTVTKPMAYAREQEGRSQDILTVREAAAKGKTITLQQARKMREDKEKMPPPEVPPQRERPAAPPDSQSAPASKKIDARRVSFSKGDGSDDEKEEVFRPSKFGSPTSGRPEIGEEENFGGKFQDMKKVVARMPGESRKFYKKRVHASIRSVNKGGKPILDVEQQPKATPKAQPRSILKSRAAAESSAAKASTKKTAVKGSFRAKVALKSREKKEREQMDRLWDSVESRRVQEEYPW